MTTNEYYPSPPESLPESYSSQQPLAPSNYKGGNYGITPLMAFIMGRNHHQPKEYTIATVCDKYLGHSSDVNVQNDDGDTALHLACQFGRFEIAERLVTHFHADLTLYNNAGLIPLHVAVCANQLQIVRMMLDFCRSITECYEQPNERYNIIDLKSDCIVGDTALIMAVKNNANEMVKLLIEFKANVNAVDNDGLSALHYCAKVNNPQAAEILILNGAQIGAQDGNEKTPLNLALSELGTLETADVLIQNNAYVTNEDQIAYAKKRQILEATNLILGDSNTDKKMPIESHKRKLSDTTVNESVKTNVAGKSRAKKPCKSIEKQQPVKNSNQLYSPPTNQPPPIQSYDMYASSYYSDPNAAQYDYYRYNAYSASSHVNYAFQHQQPPTQTQTNSNQAFVGSNSFFGTTETYAAYF